MTKKEGSATHLENILLEEVVEILDGMRKPIKKEDRQKGEIPYYGATGIIDWVKDYIFNEPLILVGEDGENLRSRVLPQAFKVEGKTWVNNHAHVLRPLQNTDINYLTYYLDSIDYENFITGSAQPKLNQKQLRKIKVLLPEIREQQKIAKILTSVDDVIKMTEVIIEKSNQVKKGLMEHLLTKGIGHTHFMKTEIGEIPKTWVVKSLNDVLSQMTDYVANGSFKSIKENVTVYDVPEYAYYVRLYDLRLGLGHSSQKYVDQKSYDFLRKSTLNGNEILVANIGANVGEVILMPNVNKPATIAPNMIVLRVKEGFNNKFLYYYLSSSVGQKVIANEISGSGQPKLNKTGLKTVLIAIPSIQEQKEIETILTTVDEKINVEQQKLTQLHVIKKGLMQVLLTGKVQVKVSEEEVITS